MILISKKIFIIIFLLLTSQILFANEQCPVGASLIFSNGMFNSYEDARDSLQELKNHFVYDFYDFHIAYNHNEKILLQLLQVFDQKKSTTEKFLWSYFSKLNGPKWFVDLINVKISNLTAKMYIDDSDLQSQVELYAKLDDGKGFFIVAHSQGNFYANYAYDYLIKDSRYEFKKPLFRIIAVATPDSRVSGDKYGGYFNLNSDGLIKLTPLALKPNISNSNPGLFDHEFINHYMRGNPSGNNINNFIKSNIALDFPDELSVMPQSFMAMSKWVAYAERNPPSELSLHECLAVSLYFETIAWNTSCEERNLNEIKNTAYKCFDKEWKDDQRQVWYTCHLTGLHSSTDSAELGKGRSYYFLNNYKNCYWEKGKVNERMSKDLINKAVEFIKNPVFRQN